MVNFTKIWEVFVHGVKTLWRIYKIEILSGIWAYKHV
jgi:hypothetical protein